MIDTKPALKALENAKINSKLVKECLDSFLARNKIYLSF